MHRSAGAHELNASAIGALSGMAVRDIESHALGSMALANEDVRGMNAPPPAKNRQGRNRR
jgi:hypothetical protein